MSNFTHILAQLFEKLSFLVQVELFWRSVIFVGVQKKSLDYCINADALTCDVDISKWNHVLGMNVLVKSLLNQVLGFETRQRLHLLVQKYQLQVEASPAQRFLYLKTNDMLVVSSNKLFCMHVLPEHEY